MHPKGRTGVTVKKCWTKERVKPSRANSKSIAPSLIPNVVDGSNRPTLVFSIKYISLLSWFHSLFGANLGRHITPLTSLISSLSIQATF